MSQREGSSTDATAGRVWAGRERRGTGDTYVRRSVQVCDAMSAAWMLVRREELRALCECVRALCRGPREAEGWRSRVV